MGVSVAWCCLDLPAPPGSFNKAFFLCSQVLWDYLNGKMLLSYNQEVEMQVAILLLFQHWAKTEQESSVPPRYVCLRVGLCCHHMG